MRLETDRDYLQHLCNLLRSYPETHADDTIKLMIGLEHVLVCLDIYDFDLEANLDLWRDIRAALAAHPLRLNGETLLYARNGKEEKAGRWWHNPRNWSPEGRSEREELEEIIAFFSEFQEGGDKRRVVYFFHVLDELDRSKNADLWERVERAAKGNPALRSVRWKGFLAGSEKPTDKWWWKLYDEQ